MRALPLILFLALLGPLYAQNIFDDEGLDKPEVADPQPAVKKKTTGEDAAEKVAAKPKKKKKARKKKKSAARAEPGQVGYSPEEIAKSSYSWAPETETLQLASTAPGLKSAENKGTNKPAEVMAKSEAVEIKPPPQSFKLPQIPVAQVLIVAAFVVLFLIYRFRVGRQIKRRKY